MIFDGLDELLDTSRRRDVSARVEQFCSAYPLTPVLITSRLVGYDQARLDSSKFTCYRLGGFGDTEVAEYAGKWFAVQEGATPATAQAEAAAFLTESATAPDLRSNPLLSLMCILYRGAGSLPRDRAGIYAKCAELLFGRWDERRRIHRELRMDYLVEAALRHLAWWMFTATSGWAVVSAGKIAAAHLAAVSDSPEELARILAPSLREDGWDVVGELAIQVKDRTSDRGADRVYTALLDPALRGEPDSGEFLFLAGCLDSVRPSPATVRMLTRAILDDTFRWRTWVRRLADRYAAEITSLAWRSEYFRAAALYAGAISLEQVLTMMGGLSLLMRPVRRRLIVEDGLPYPLGLICARCFGWPRLSR